MRVSGEVSRIRHYKPDSGWCSFVLKMEGSLETIPVVGIFPDLEEHDSLEVEGEVQVHPTFGKQIKASHYRMRLPTSDESIERYLAWALPQIGPVRAHQMVRAHGDQLFRVLDESPDVLLEIKGITPDRLQEIKVCWSASAPKREAHLFFAQFQLGRSQIEELLVRLGQDAVAQVKEDPYILLYHTNLGFKRIDKLALRLGVDPNSPVRRKAVLLYVVRESAWSGNVYLSYIEIRSALREFNALGMETSWSLDEVRQCVSELVERGDLYQEEDRIYSTPLYLAEVGASKALLGMQFNAVGFPLANRELSYTEEEFFALDPNTWFDSVPEGVEGALETPVGKLFLDADVDAFIEAYQGLHGVAFSEAQRRAIHQANQSRVFLLTGLPGTGKTTVLRAVLALYEKAALKVQLCAPTGKAAKRIQQVIRRPASTIHRYLGLGTGDQDGLGAPGAPVSENAVIVDEFSMVDVRLFHALLSHLTDQHYLVMVGDPGQLPSVGPGSVLKDLIESGKVPRVHLEEIFRQAATSSIITNAHAIHHGKDLELKPNSDFFVVYRETPQSTMEALQTACSRLLEKGEPFQVMSPRKTGPLGTAEINAVLKPLMNPRSLHSEKVEWGDRSYSVGDRVLMTRNNYSKKVFNGDVGEVVEIDGPKKLVFVVFEDSEGSELERVRFQGPDLEDLELAYALTVHKSQGSEWDTVILLVAGVHGNRILKRRLVYTAVTRAKKKLVVLTDKTTLLRAINNTSDDQRNTTLCRFLQLPVEDLEKRIQQCSYLHARI